MNRSFILTFLPAIHPENPGNKVKRLLQTGKDVTAVQESDVRGREDTRRLSTCRVFCII